MKYLSLFTGIGGFELGIQQAYVDSINRSQNPRSESNPKKNDAQGARLESKTRKGSRAAARPIGKHADDRRQRYEPPHCVGFSEIDKYAIQIYKRHSPNHEHKNFGDITKIDAKKLPDFDLLVGGFPCQSFSVAGKRRGFQDTRGTLFFDIARIIKEKRPRLLVLENVKGILSHDEGKTILVIISALDELGYDLQWQVLNSKNFGVPQNRERIFIVGHLRGTPRPQVFPIGKSDRLPASGERARTTSSGISPAVTSNLKRGVHSGGEAYIQSVPHGFNKGWKKEFPNLRSSSGAVHNEIVVQNPGVHQDYRIYSKEGISPTLNANRGGGSAKHPFIPIGTKIRRLTPTECERLQGFPDGWTEGVSDTQRYKTLGNAVTVNVIKEIMKYIL